MLSAAMLKKIALAFAALIVLLLVLIGGWAAYISATWDKDYSQVPLPAITASTDPAVIARGEYVAHSLAHCSICHVPLETTLQRRAGEHPAMAGGFEWKMGPFGTLYSRNITNDKETGIGAWSDGELARAIKWGIGKDGKLLPFMSLGAPAMADEDVTALVSYLRSAAPVQQKNKPHEPGLVLKWMATKMGPEVRKPFLDGQRYAEPGTEPSLARGEYLARGPAWCVGCHTPFDIMTMKPSGAEFSGSDQPEPDKDDAKMVFRIPNLTPDPETGHLSKWDEDGFITRFRAGRILKSSKMPWEAYREMTDADLRSVFRFLKALPPAKHYIGPTHRPSADDPSKDPIASR